MDSGSVPIQLTEMEIKMEILQVFWLFLNFTSNKTFTTENVLKKSIEKLRNLIQHIFVFAELFYLSKILIILNASNMSLHSWTKQYNFCYLI